MSDTFEHNKPYSLTATFQEYPAQSDLTSPYDLHVNFDESAGGSERYVGAHGFSATQFGTPVLFFTQFITTSGWVASAFGTATLYNLTQYLHASSIVGFHDGTPTVENRARVVAPFGWEATQHSTHAIRNSTQQVFAGVGSSTMVFGDDISIINRNAYLSPAGFNAAIYGTNRVEHYRRTMLASGFSQTALGVLNISNANRTIAPAGIYTVFPSNHLVGGTQYINVIGFSATLFGTRIIPERQYVYPSGFKGEIGQASVRNRRSVIIPNGFATGGQQPADRWGRAKVYNLRQYITMYHQEDSGLGPPAWSKWQKVENRNRVITTFGQNASRFAEPIIANNARVLAPSSITAPSEPPYYKAGMVSHRVRTLPLQGIEPPYMASWTRVYNDARVVSAKGSISSVFGVASVVKTRRYFDHIGGFNTSVFGTPMIADRVRTVSIESRYSIGPPSIKLPIVKLYTRYVDGIGQDLSRFGSPSLTIHKNIITPRWTLKNYFGTPAVRNNTPELHLYGHNSAEFGTAKVRLQWRPLPVFGTSMQVFGTTEIAFRDRIRFIKGFDAGVVSDKLIITKTGTPPYTVQRIEVAGFSEDSPSRFGIPALNQQVLYVSQPSSFTVFGTPSVSANTIRVEPGYQELLVGTPTVSLKIRTISVFGWAEDTTPSKPRLSPHTIWAVVEAPSQAQANNPAIGDLHYVNSDSGSRQAGEVFGTVTVRGTGARYIRPIGHNGSSYGQATLELKRRYIEPPSIRSLRFGWLQIPGDQTLEQFESKDSMSFGSISVGRPPYLGPQALFCAGLDSFVAGNALIETRNRTIKPIGHDSMVMGASLAGDTPYMWQSLRIGPRVPIVANGKDMSTFGLTWISNRVRELGVSGFESFLCEYQLEAFDKRMKVTRRVIPPVARQLTPVGISAFTSGTPNVRAGVHYIRPDGNADQYRKGAF